MGGMVFGQTRVCRCQKGEMRVEDRRRRQKELRIAKRNGTKPPPLTRGVDCGLCGGKGYVTA